MTGVGLPADVAAKAAQHAAHLKYLPARDDPVYQVGCVRGLAWLSSTPGY
jgi:hypothetical protein